MKIIKRNNDNKIQNVNGKQLNFKVWYMHKKLNIKKNRLKS